MRVALLALVACGTPAKPTRVTPPPPAPIDAAPPDAPGPLVRRGTPHPPTEAPHGGPITSLALNAEGTAAVTTDGLGGARLWPALDGKLEPRILELPHTRALAIGTRGDRFALAAIDDVGNLALDVVDANGSLLQRAQAQGELTYIDVLETARGPLAARVDEQLVQLDDDGASTGAIAVDPGERIVELATAGAYPYALIEKQGDTPAYALRWIEPGPRWGAWIEPGVPIGPMLAISPSGKRLAVLERDANNRPRLIVVDLASKSRVYEASESAVARPVFADDEHLAIQNNTALHWIDLTAPRPVIEQTAVVAGEPVPKGGIHIVAAETGGGRIVAPRFGELAISTFGHTDYLGYELQAPAIATRAPNGQLLIGGEDRFSLLDAQLHEVAQLDLAQPLQTVAAVRYLAGNDWLVHTVGSTGSSLLVVDPVAHKTQVARTKMDVVHQLQFDPHTNLVALSLGEQPEVLRYDPAKHRVDPVALLPRTKSASQRMVFPVGSPHAQLVIVEFANQVTIHWVPDAAHPEVGIASTIQGSYAGIDSTGRAYVWKNGGLSIYDDGAEVGTVPNALVGGLFPSPGGAMFVHFLNRVVALMLADGTQRWSRALEGANDVVWLDDGAFALVGGAGLARIDAATGQLQAARCGWRFGFSPRPHVEVQRVEPLCAQLRD